MNFYFQAANTLDHLDAKQGSIKGLLGNVPEKNRKRTAALVIETLKYKSALMEVIVSSKLLKEERKITSMNLALVLVHDLLLSKGIEAADGPVKQAILRHKTRLNGEFQKLKIKRGAKSNQDLAQAEDPRAARIPRYVRVNTTFWTSDEAVQSFLAEGYELSDPFTSSKGFSRDEHIPDLFLFPPQKQFNDSPLYKSGKIILQDKASCFPAFVLSPPAQDGSAVIDATAAPGNKTSHLSALMKNKGKLFAFERDKRRFSTLQRMLEKSGCRNVEPVNADFLTVSPHDKKYVSVTHILLDPSCSGSGIVNRLDYLVDAEDENDDSQEQRLNKLAAFQLMMIKHAMKFPSVAKIVYSTCSVHAVENEQVVRAALHSEEAKAGRFVLLPRTQVLPTWHRRGVPGFMDPDAASCLVRCSPGDDGTNGFFVACFTRSSSLAEGDITKSSTDRKRKAASMGSLDGAQRGVGQPRKKRKMGKKRSQ